MSRMRSNKPIGKRLAMHVADLKSRIKELEQDLLLMQSRHGRVLKAYLALRKVKTLQPDEARTPAFARYIQLEEDLKRDDLKETQ